MNPFIKKHEYNYIKKCLFDLNSTFINCTDPNIIEASKSYIQNKIMDKFQNLSNDQREIIDITKITEPLQIDIFIKRLDQYVYGMSSISSKDLTKALKKEKKLKLPDINMENKKLIYLGWIDPSIRKLLIVYNLNGKLLGMACRLTDYKSTTANICTLCSHMGKDDEVAFVSPICKTSSSSIDAYKSMGFHICLDSEKCNERITSIEKLESILKEVNNIKE